MNTMTRREQIERYVVRQSQAETGKWYVMDRYTDSITGWYSTRNSAEHSALRGNMAENSAE